MADRACGHHVPASSCILNQSGVLPKLRTETAFLDGARLATSFSNLSFHEVAVLLLYIWRSSGLDKFDEAAVAIAIKAQVVQHWRADVAIGR